MEPTVLPLVIFGLYGGFALLEQVRPLRFKPSPFLRPFFATDVVWFLLAIGVPLSLRPYLAELSFVGPARWEGVPFPLQLLIAVALYDLVAFLVHMLVHRVNALWEVHKVHHSSRTLDWLATTRQHVIEGLLRQTPAQGALFLVGLPLEAIVGALAIYVGFAVLGHSNLRLNMPWLEPLVITPRLHRLHHVPETVEHNFGTVFSIWDRLFGHLVVKNTSPYEPLGVPGEIETYPQHFVSALKEPMRQILTSRAARRSASTPSRDRSWKAPRVGPTLAALLEETVERTLIRNRTRSTLSMSGCEPKGDSNES